MTARRPYVRIFVFVILVISIVALLIYVLAVQQQRVEAAESRGQAKDDQIAALIDANRELAQDCAIAEDCETDAPTPTEILDDNPVPESPESVNGRDGARGPAGPEGRMGVPGQTGPQGPAGAPGESGADGATGSAGEPGETGVQGATGPQGAPGAPGADGPQGPAGSSGADGRSIADTQCVGEGDRSFWQFTYSDSTIGTSPGPCRLVPLLTR